MDSQKRARQKANRAQKIETIQKQEKRDQRRQYVMIVVLVAAALLGGLYLLSIAGDDDTAATTTTAADGTADSAGATTTAPPVEAGASAVSIPAPGLTAEGTPECPEEDGSSERTTLFSEAPPTCIDEGATYEAVIETTLGPITVELDAEAAPVTVNSFVFLARYHFYEGSPFHRIIPGFVIQGGDGDSPETADDHEPGYTIVEEPPPAEGDGPFYEIGSLAMAKPPGQDVTGSQFFIITGENGVALPPEYSLFGKVTAGLDVAEAIEAIPTNAADEPLEEIYIESVTINEK